MPLPLLRPLLSVWLLSVPKLPSSMNGLTMRDVLSVSPDYPLPVKAVSQICWESQSYSNSCQLHPSTRGKVVPAWAKREISLSKWIIAAIWPRRLLNRSGWAGNLTSATKPHTACAKSICFMRPLCLCTLTVSVLPSGFVWRDTVYTPAVITWSRAFFCLSEAHNRPSSPDAI